MTTEKPAMPRTILVIDDNPLVREVVRQMLEFRGYLVLVAEGGSDGLGLMETHRIDAAIIDVDMPRMNGIEVCRALVHKAAQIGSNVCVWLMTGVLRPGLTAGAAAAGALGVLAKPFTTDELVGCVERQFRNHAA